jgi:3-carboxy-cis,cis-muconate cycloisomerase
MELYAPLFSDPAVDAHFSADAQVRAMLAVEVALAEAHAAAGLISRHAVDAIRAAAQVERYDLQSLARDAARAGNLAIPVVSRLTRETEAIDPAAAKMVHLGATSQDVIDTGMVLQLRAALPSLTEHLERAARAAARHARRHRRTPQAGRTWLQQATPITFGLKAAGWLDALERVRNRLQRAASEAFVLQFGGASGTLAALGPDADVVARSLADGLRLELPSLPWHAHRDRLVTLACALGVVTGTLGKIAMDLALLAQTEVAEAHEEHATGRGGSSTMPHKQNPVSAAVALAAAVRVPGLVSSMLAAMPQEHERGLGGWHAEWEVMPELVRLTSGAARSVGDALEHLAIDTARMGSNLEMTRGLIQAEAVVSALAPRLGRSAAHAIVEEASRRAAAAERPLAATLAEHADVVRVLSAEMISRLLEPGEYLGQADVFVDRVLAAWGRDGEDDA